jgi:hypothetical protein
VEPRKLKDLFTSDPHAAVVAMVRTSSRPLARADVVEQLTAAGVSRADATKKWNSVRDLTLKPHPNVRRVGANWAWTDQPLAADVALKQLRAMLDVRKKYHAVVGDALVQMIHSGLSATGGEPASDDNKIRAAQDRQLVVDGLLHLAELAGEMEFVAYNTDDPDVILERIRGGAHRLGLTQLGEIGTTATFNPTEHAPVGRTPADGSTIRIVRPGYSGRYRGEVILLRKAEVAAT